MSRISENDIAITLKSTVLHIWQISFFFQALSDGLTFS
jgi:hypothetical protein